MEIFFGQIYNTEKTEKSNFLIFEFSEIEKKNVFKSCDVLHL